MIAGELEERNEKYPVLELAYKVKISLNVGIVTIVKNDFIYELEYIVDIPLQRSPLILSNLL